MKKRKLKDMSDDDLNREVLVQENLESKRKLMRMTEEMEELKEVMEELNHQHENLLDQFDELREKHRNTIEEMKELKDLREEIEKLKKEKQRNGDDIPVLNAKKVAQCLNMAQCIELMYDAFLGFELKNLQQPLRSGYRLPLEDKKVGILASMPAFYSSSDDYTGKFAGVWDVPYCSTKVITVFPSNSKIGKHSHQGVIALFEAKTGETKAIIDATEVTAKRTAAASAVATKLLACDDSEILALIGCGEQAKTHLEAMLIVYPRISEVRVWSRTRSNVEAFVKKARAMYLGNCPVLKFVISSSVRDACKAADIICTLTASRVPLVTKDMVKPGAHINAVGACTPDMHELSSDLVVSAKIVADDREACLKEPGDIVTPLRNGIDVKINCTIGELVRHELSVYGADTGRHNAHIGRRSDTDITIYESLGLAIQDLACAVYLYEHSC